MDQIKKSATSTADGAGIGPNDSSTIDKAQEYVAKGIDSAQNSVFGQNQTGKTDEAAKEQSEKRSKLSEAVDAAHPAVVEEFQRHKNRSEVYKGTEG